MSDRGGEAIVRREGLRGALLEVTLMAAYGCDSCQKTSLGYITRTDPEFNNNMNDYAIRYALDVMNDELSWLPVAAMGRDFPDVPSHIAEAAGEAYKCSEVHAYRASALLARAVIEATAKEKGITQGNLNAKIDAMFAKGLIREHIKDAAHEIRYAGNDMAHGDFINPVSSEDAELILTLMNEILEEVFQSPARVARAKAARLAKVMPATGSS